MTNPYLKQYKRLLAVFDTDLRADIPQLFQYCKMAFSISKKKLQKEL